MKLYTVEISEAGIALAIAIEIAIAFEIDLDYDLDYDLGWMVREAKIMPCLPCWIGHELLSLEQ